MVQRTGLHREAIENLILIGALNEFGLERRTLLWQLGLFAGVSKQRRVRAKAGAGSEAGAERGRQYALPLPVDGDMVALRPMTDWERLVADHHALEFSPSTHPLGLLRQWLGEDVHTSRHVEHLPDGAAVHIAGLVVCRQQPVTAKGVLFVLLEDEFGLTNVVVHRGLYDRQRAVIRAEPFVIVDGVVQRRDAVVNILAHSFTCFRPPRALTAPASRDFH